MLLPISQVLRADKHRLALLEEEASLIAALDQAGTEEDGEVKQERGSSSAAPSLEALSLNDDDDSGDDDDKKHSKKKKPARKNKKGSKAPGEEESGSSSSSSSSSSSLPSQVHDDAWWSATMARLAEVIQGG